MLLFLVLFTIYKNTKHPAAYFCTLFKVCKTLLQFYFCRPIRLDIYIFFQVSIRRNSIKQRSLILELILRFEVDRSSQIVIRFSKVKLPIGGAMRIVIRNYKQEKSKDALKSHFRLSKDIRQQTF